MDLKELSQFVQRGNAKKVKEMQQTLERLDKKIDGYEERVLVKEDKLKRTDE